jgi:membrane protein DedA with SNARE-associated domain
MNLLDYQGPLVYLAIVIATIVEGEVTFVTASTLVAEGRLNALAVFVAGAVGSAIGDQAYFYVFRGRLDKLIARFPKLQRRAEPLVWRVKRHDSAMVLLIRFAPGLRVALAAACAYANVSPFKFSMLNTITCFIWALVLLTLVAFVGPTYLARFGLSGWKGALLVGLLIVFVFKFGGVFERRKIEREQEGRNRG